MTDTGRNMFVPSIISYSELLLDIVVASYIAIWLVHSLKNTCALSDINVAIEIHIW